MISISLMPFKNVPPNYQLNWENDYFSNFFISAESKSLYRERYRTNALDSPFRMSNDSSVWSWIFPRKASPRGEKIKVLASEKLIELTVSEVEEAMTNLLKAD